MKGEEKCKIIQDLLPSYIDHLTSDETNHYIEEHLHSCEKCTKVLEDMKDNTNILAKEQLKPNRETNYLKKFNKKFRIIQLLLIVIVLIFLFFVIGKLIILTGLRIKCSYWNTTKIENQYAKISTYNTDEMSIIELYYKDGDILVNHEYYAYHDKEKSYISSLYQANGENFAIIDYLDGRKEIIANFVSTDMFLTTSVENFPLGDISFTIFSDIQKITLNERKYYSIKYNNIEQVIDIETGIKVKQIDYNTNETIDYFYSFGTVKDTDIIRPDTTGYEEVEM